MVGETIRIYNAMEYKMSYIKNKFRDNWELIDYEIRAVFGTAAKTSKIKYVSRYNHTSNRNKLINGDMISNQCIQCLEVENWENIILCRLNDELRQEFITKLRDEVLKI